MSNNFEERSHAEHTHTHTHWVDRTDFMHIYDIIIEREFQEHAKHDNNEDNNNNNNGTNYVHIYIQPEQMCMIC